MLPHASVAFQVRSIPDCPVQPVVPASVCEMVGLPPQLSVAVAVPVLAGSDEAPHCSGASDGQVMVGGAVSTRVMCCTQVETLPQPSVAFQVRSIADWPVQLEALASVWVIVTPAGQLSPAVAVPVLDGSVEAPHCSWLSAGHEMLGGAASEKVRCCTQELALLQESLTVQVRSIPD
jgi:hypothetical protein